MDINLLNSFGLTKTEAKIYTEILKHKETTIGPIIKITGLHRGTVYNSINNLIKKGFLCFIDKEGFRYYKSTGEKIFENLLIEKKEKIDNEKTTIKDFFEHIKKFKENIEEGNVDVFYGVEAFKTLFLDIYDKCKESNCEYLFQGMGGEMQDATGEGFYKYTQKLKKKMKIKCRVILNSESIILPYHKYVVGNLKYLSKGIHTPVNFWIYRDTVLLALFRTNPLTSIRIRSKLLANSFRDYFEYLWKIAKTGNILGNKEDYDTNQNSSDSLVNLNENLKSGQIEDLVREIIKSKKDFWTLYFDSFAKRREFIQKFEKIAVPALKRNKVVVIQTPPGFPSVTSQPDIKERLNFLKKYKFKIYRLYEGNSFFDKLSASVFESLGAKIKLGVKSKNKSWFNICGDYIIQTIPNEKLREKGDKFFSTQKKFDDSFHKFTQNFYYKKCKVKVLVQKNPDLAKKLIEQILNYFK